MKAYQLIFSLESENDLIDIQHYISQESNNPIIADNFVTDLYQTLITSLPHFPQKHPVYNNTVRKFIFPKYTHYTAYFAIDEKRS